MNPRFALAVSNGALKDNAEYVAKDIDEILTETGAESVNIVPSEI